MRTGPFDPPVWDEDEDAVLDWEETELYRRWYQRVVDGNNDYFVLVSPSHYTSGSGSGKTTLACQLAKRFDISSDGFDASENGTVDAFDLSRNVFRESAKGSAILFDEGQGTSSTVGLDSRRAMKDTVINAINDILANRDRQYTVIFVTQQVEMLDPRLVGMVDSWLMIDRDPEQQGGPRAKHHELVANDYDWSNVDPKTPVLEYLEWEALPEDDPAYATMQAQKHATQQGGDEEEEDTTVLQELSKEARDELIRERVADGVEQQVVAETFGLTPQRVSQIVNED